MFQRIEAMGGVLQDAVGSVVANLEGSGRRDTLLVIGAAAAGYLVAALVGALCRDRDRSVTRQILGAIRLPLSLSIGSAGLLLVLRGHSRPSLALALLLLATCWAVAAGLLAAGLLGLLARRLRRRWDRDGARADELSIDRARFRQRLGQEIARVGDSAGPTLTVVACDVPRGARRRRRRQRALWRLAGQQLKEHDLVQRGEDRSVIFALGDASEARLHQLIGEISRGDGIVGWAEYPADGTDAESLLIRARARMVVDRSDEGTEPTTVHPSPSMFWPEKTVPLGDEDILGEASAQSERSDLGASSEAEPLQIPFPKTTDGANGSAVIGDASQH